MRRERETYLNTRVNLICCELCITPASTTITFSPTSSNSHRKGYYFRNDTDRQDVSEMLTFQNELMADYLFLTGRRTLVPTNRCSIRVKGCDEEHHSILCIPPRWTNYRHETVTDIVPGRRLITAVRRKSTLTMMKQDLRLDRIEGETASDRERL